MARDAAVCIMRGGELDIRSDGGAPAFQTAVDVLVSVGSIVDVAYRLHAGADGVRRDFVDSPPASAFSKPPSPRSSVAKT